MLDFCQWGNHLAELRSMLSWGTTFDLRRRRFPKPTNPCRNLLIFMKENTLWRILFKQYSIFDICNYIYCKNNNFYSPCNFFEKHYFHSDIKCLRFCRQRHLLFCTGIIHLYFQLYPDPPQLSSSYQLFFYCIYICICLPQGQMAPPPSLWQGKLNISYLTLPHNLSKEMRWTAWTVSSFIGP